MQLARLESQTHDRREEGDGLTRKGPQASMDRRISEQDSDVPGVITTCIPLGICSSPRLQASPQACSELCFDVTQCLPNADFSEDVKMARIDQLLN